MSLATRYALTLYLSGGLIWSCDRSVLRPENTSAALVSTLESGAPGLSSVTAGPALLGRREGDSGAYPLRVYERVEHAASVYTYMYAYIACLPMAGPH